MFNKINSFFKKMNQVSANQMNSVHDKAYTQLDKIVEGATGFAGAKAYATVLSSWATFKITTLEYLGGLYEVPKSNIDMKIAPTPKGLVIGFNGSGKLIPYDSINVTLQTKESIHRDVTLTRLVTLGVWAFAFKKVRKDINQYLVIKYKEFGQDCSIIFAGENVGTAYKNIMMDMQSYYMNNTESV